MIYLVLYNNNNTQKTKEKYIEREIDRKIMCNMRHCLYFENGQIRNTFIILWHNVVTRSYVSVQYARK